jgi:hypothetical protein
MTSVIAVPAFTAVRVASAYFPGMFTDIPLLNRAWYTLEGNPVATFAVSVLETSRDFSMR